MPCLFCVSSSREHATLAPLQLGVKAAIVLSFARIHMDNLINNGILPLTFSDAKDYEKIALMDELSISNLHQQVKNAVSGKEITVTNKTKGYDFSVVCSISERQAAILLSGGLLNYTRTISS